MSNMSKCLFGGTILAAGLGASASAQNWEIREFDGTGVATVIVESWDLGTLPDMGIIGFDGPCGPAGSGPIPAGFLTYSTFDSEYSGPGGASRGAGGGGLVGVGPSAGFGNPANAVLANFFVDAFNIDFGGVRDEFTWTGVSLLGGPGYDLYVDGVLAFPGLSNDVTYTLTGSFSEVSMYDPTGGAEGIYGYAEVGVIPAPASLALLGLGGLVARRRR